MKVEIVSIGDELLVSDVLDTSIAHVSRSLRENNLPITCKVTVGSDLEMILDVLRTALTRADVVLAIHEGASHSDSLLFAALTRLLGEMGHVGTDPAAMNFTAVIDGKQVRLPGVWVESLSGLIFCLSREHQAMAYMLETAVLPYLRSRVQQAAKRKTDWRLLRAVGIVESSARLLLADLPVPPGSRITIDSFAGQTTIRLGSEGRTAGEVHARLAQLEEGVMARLGDHVFGAADTRLEHVMARMLAASGKKLVLAECHTNHFVGNTLSALPDSQAYLLVIPTADSTQLANYLRTLPPDNDLTGWCRATANRMLRAKNAGIGLLVYKNVTPGGMQILVTLASPGGVSVTQRSFGGHPENIDAWAFSLGMAHLRRWLLAHA